MKIPVNDQCRYLIICSGLMSNKYITDIETCTPRLTYVQPGPIGRYTVVEIGLWEGFKSTLQR